MERQISPLEHLKKLNDLPRLIRTTSDQFESSCRDSALTKGLEEEIAEAADQTLKILRGSERTGAMFARVDIVNGLSAIDHPLTQLILAETIMDPEIIVSSRARSRLAQPERVIYSESLIFLLNHGNEELRDLGLAILEKNETAGLGDKVDESEEKKRNVAEVVEHSLEMLITLEDLDLSVRVAIASSYLHQRNKVGDDLFDSASEVLENEIFVRNDEIESRFPELVEEITLVNLARVLREGKTEGILLDLPPKYAREPEVIQALTRLQSGRENDYEELKMYKGLLALAKVKARAVLNLKVAEDKVREAEEKKREAELKVRKDLEDKRISDERKARTDVAIAEEVSLAEEAKKWFPGLE